jgi:hypothetical protein
VQRSWWTRPESASWQREWCPMKIAQIAPLSGRCRASGQRKFPNQSRRTYQWCDDALRLTARPGSAVPLPNMIAGEHDSNRLSELVLNDLADPAAFRTRPAAGYGNRRRSVARWSGSSSAPDSAINLRDAQIVPAFGTFPPRLGPAASGVFFCRKNTLPPRPQRG